MRARLDHLMYVILGLFGFQVPSANADTLVLCFDHPDLQGESTVKGHEGCIDILSWQWGLGNAGMGSPASFSDLTVTKEMDKASPGLALETSNPAKAVGVAELFQYRCDPDCVGDLKFQLTLDGVIVTSLSDSSGGASVSESVSLNYTKMTYCYTEPGGKAIHCQSLVP